MLWADAGDNGETSGPPSEPREVPCFPDEDSALGLRVQYIRFSFPFSKIPFAEGINRPENKAHDPAS